MKALTIVQPYAHLIATGEKRVENRTWYTKHRGPLAIHAGKNRDGLRDCGLVPDGYAFGAIIATVNVIDCLFYGEIANGMHRKKYPWLCKHEHAFGPWCWILDDAESIKPIPMNGKLGLFNVEL